MKMVAQMRKENNAVIYRQSACVQRKSERIFLRKSWLLVAQL
jgi:hypothetical protein